VLPQGIRDFTIEWAATRDPLEAYANVWGVHAASLTQSELKANVANAILYDGVIEYYKRLVEEADVVTLLSMQTSLGDIALMYQDAYKVAKAGNNAAAMVSAANKLASLHRIDPLTNSQITRNENAAKDPDNANADYDKVLSTLADKLPE